jgi:hypothetical protein
VILLLGIYPKEHKSGFNRDIYTPLFILALLILAKLWKQPRCPTTDEWIKKMWYIYTIEFYSVIRNNDMWFEGKWIQLEGIMLSEVSQAQTKSACFLSYMEDGSKREAYKQKQA